MMSSMTAPAAFQASEATDVSLLERVAEGSADALASLYDRHAGAVYSIAARTISTIPICCRSSRILPVMMLLRSSRSLMS